MQTISDSEFLRAIAETRSFTHGTPQGFQLTPDGKSVLFLRGLARKNELRLYLFDLESGRERELASSESVLGLQAGAGESLSAEELARRERMRITARGITSYQLASHGRFAVFMLGGRAFALELAGGAAQELAGPDAKGNPIFDPQLSPDAQSIAFLQDGELWTQRFQIGNGQPSTFSTPIQLTRGASATLLHGRAEFVAQEELARFRGYWWSPDSRSILYQEVDESAVEKLFLQDPQQEFRAPIPQAYPRPGKANAKCRFGIVAADGTSAETRWLAVDPAWEYVARVEWPTPGTLLFIVLSRDQRELALLAFDETGGVRTLVREHDEAFLNSARELTWLPENHGFLWSSDASGALELQHRGPDGAPLRTLIAGDFGFSSLCGFDQKTVSVFLLRHPTPLASELWELPIANERALSAADAGVAKQLAPAPGTGESVSAIFARRSRAHLRISSPRQGAARFEAFDVKGTFAGRVESAAEAPPFEASIELSQVGPAPRVANGEPARDGGIWSLLVRPRNLVIKGNHSPASFPLLVQVYGGPHVNTVRANAASYLLDQWIADHGFFVLRADNRGTPLRGRDWERSIAGKFAEVPLEDQISAVRAWAEKEPSIDLQRVGVMGHSFGGFLAALAVLRRPEIFKCAVAGAPVVDWMNYDTAYTERYLGVPPPEGKAGYSKDGLLGYAADTQLSPRPLLISHGTADDNVHFSESLLLADALFRAGKPFELLPQLGQTHQFHQPELMIRYWERIFAFFRAHL